MISFAKVILQYHVVFIIAKHIAIVQAYCHNYFIRNQLLPYLNFKYLTTTITIALMWGLITPLINIRVLVVLVYGVGSYNTTDHYPCIGCVNEYVYCFFVNETLFFVV